MLVPLLESLLLVLLLLFASRAWMMDAPLVVPIEEMLMVPSSGNGELGSNLSAQ